MEVNHQELTTQLWDLLTEEEIADGVVSITYDCGINTNLKIGIDMVEKLLAKSPWRNHIIGFKRDCVGIDLVLDEEGQVKWNDKMREIQAWCDKYGCD
jgi:hypothetical protein